MEGVQGLSAPPRGAGQIATAAVTFRCRHTHTYRQSEQSSKSLMFLTALVWYDPISEVVLLEIR